MRMVRREPPRWTRSSFRGADPLMLVLALCVALVLRLNPRALERSGASILHSHSAVPLAFSAGSPFAARGHRRSVPAPVAILALTTLAGHWCCDARRRIPLAALAAAILTGQLVYAGDVGWPAPVDRSPGMTAFSFPEALRTVPWLVGQPQLPRLPRLPQPDWPSFFDPVRSPHTTASPAGTVEGPEAGRSEAAGAAAPRADATSSRSAHSPSSAVPAAQAIRAEWQSSDAATVPFPERIEAWRPLVRELLAEAWHEGRLDGPASQLDDDLVLALVRQESGGNPDALSWAGAIGLMQVMPFTFAEMLHGDRALTCAIDPAAMWDVRSNVRAGLRYLALAMQAHEGNVYWALASYNAGIDAVNDWRGAGLYAVPPIGGYIETAGYAPAILGDYLRRRSDVTLSVPTRMVSDHVPGAIRLLRDLDASRPPRPKEVYPRCTDR